MNDKERQLLRGFLDNLTHAKVSNRDPEADAMIRDAVARQPDAAYLLVQQALVQQAALTRAQSRASGADASVEEGAKAVPPARGGGWSNRPRAVAAQPTMDSQGPGGGVGDFLRSAAATAVGVAGGAMLFQGLQDLFSGDDGAGAEDGGFLSGDAPIDGGGGLTDAAALADAQGIPDSRLTQEAPLESGDGFDDGEGGLFGGLDPFGDDDSDWG